MDLIPFQTDPAHMALDELRCRILISDAVRHKSGNWRHFRNLVGQDEVRKLFDIKA